MRRKCSETKRFCRSWSSRPGSMTSLIRLNNTVLTGSYKDDAKTWKTWNLFTDLCRLGTFYQQRLGVGGPGGHARSTCPPGVPFGLNRLIILEYEICCRPW